MQNMKHIAAALIEGEEGQAMVEYPLIVALISVAAIAALTLMGGNIKAALNAAAAKITVPAP
jgi:Flp pilus assembly pilin Flp